MINHSTQSYADYAPLFSPKEANKLIEKCLAVIETDAPNMTLLLLALSDLALLVRSANYDNHVLNNLISENEILNEELERMKLAQITDQVSAMDAKLSKIEQDCQALQLELDRELQEAEYSAFQNVQTLSIGRRRLSA